MEQSSIYYFILEQLIAYKNIWAIKKIRQGQKLLVEGSKKTGELLDEIR